jgi:hypothetical protein
MAKSYSGTFHSKVLKNYSVGILGMQIYHLATLVGITFEKKNSFAVGADCDIHVGPLGNQFSYIGSTRVT